MPAPINKISRNDPCPCGSGKKYKKCCLNNDTGHTSELNATAVDVFRPAALPSGANRFVPAIACMKEDPEECLFVLARPSRPLDQVSAIDEAEADLLAAPDSVAGEVGPGCLRYLDKIGYRSMPDIGLKDLILHSERAGDDSVCEFCGESHEDHDFEGMEDDEIEDGDFEADAAEAIELLRRMASLRPNVLSMPELPDTLARLREDGFSREEAVVMVLETLARET